MKKILNLKRWIQKLAQHSNDVDMLPNLAYPAFTEEEWARAKFTAMDLLNKLGVPDEDTTEAHNAAARHRNLVFIIGYKAILAGVTNQAAAQRDLAKENREKELANVHD